MLYGKKLIPFPRSVPITKLYSVGWLVSILKAKPDDKQSDDYGLKD
jgi:hypothetical protein